MDRLTLLLGSLLAGLLTAIACCLTLPDTPTPAPDQSSPVAPLVRPHVSADTPAKWDYASVCQVVKQWQQEAPQWCEVGTYGTSSKGQALTCARLHHPASTTARKTLLTAAIHGNEPISTSTVLAWTAKLLNECPEMLADAEITLVPVVSPDSFPNSRHVDSVDPNRDFQQTRSPAVAGLKSLFNQLHPSAAMSGHSFGRLFVLPPGESRTNTPEETAYQDLFGRMGKLANYRVIHGYEMYPGQVIRGSDVDFFHQGGATACVTEFGTHQQIPTLQDTKTELDRTWAAFCLWLKESPNMRKVYQRCPLALERQ